jgi:Flp pilus assembly CpaE family ATPase
MLTFNDKLHVLTAPADMLPLDMVSPEDIGRILDVAQANFDFVIVDMPNDRRRLDRGGADAAPCLLRAAGT